MKNTGQTVTVLNVNIHSKLPSTDMVQDKIINSCISQKSNEFCTNSEEERVQKVKFQHLLDVSDKGV